MMAQRKTAQRKIDEVDLLKKYINEYNVIGLVNMEKIGARAIQKLRKSLRGKVVMRMTKKRLMKRALNESSAKKPNLEALGDEIKGISAMIFTDMNPISLGKFLSENSTKGPAKSGDIAPIDIEVKAGDTQIPPGPIISEFNVILNLTTMIKDGTIHIREDKVTHNVGDVIDLRQALLLGRLGIEPMTVTLDFYSAWENGEIIPEAVLKLDEGKIILDVQTAAVQARFLAMALGIITKETVEPLLQKAIREANIIALDLEMINPDTIPLYIAKAIQTASYINDTIFSDQPSDTEINNKSKKKEQEQTGEDDKKKAEEPTGIGGLFD